MLRLKVANNDTNNYRSCQSLYDFIRLLLQNTTKDPSWLLKKKNDLTNNFIQAKKECVLIVNDTSI